LGQEPLSYKLSKTTPYLLTYNIYTTQTLL
jgi:hypothetical protein